MFCPARSAPPAAQWRYRLAYDSSLLSAFLAVFLHVIQAWYRQQARVQGYADTRCGSVTFVQRFGSALNLNPHFHVLMLDGVDVVRAESTAPEFVPAPALQDSDVQRIVGMTAHHLVRLLQRRGVLDSPEADALAEEAPLLSALSLLPSVQVSRPLVRVQVVVCVVCFRIRAKGNAAGGCVFRRGFFSACGHAYTGRGSFGPGAAVSLRIRSTAGAGRPRLIDADHRTFRLKTPWSDETTHLVLSPLERIVLRTRLSKEADFRCGC